MDRFEYLAQEQERRDSNRLLLGLGSFIFFMFGLLCFMGASETTKTETSGHLLWKNETTVNVPTETRVGWLLAGVLLMLVALTLAVIAYRASAAGRVAVEMGDAFSGTSTDRDRSSPVTSGHSKEFWITTIIAVLGLVITAASAVTAWWG